MAFQHLRSLAQTTPIALARRGRSSAPCGRRVASADSCATRVVCEGRAFASRFSIAHSALAPVRVVAASPVNRSAPTTPSTGRCAIKPRSAGYVERYAS
jgi:hypothetical protein